ncbi:MAG: alpha/beta hydrolase [Nitrospirae bacterium]|nr:alpha/beta hydrolase [Nitrospirota bacterium]
MTLKQWLVHLFHRLVDWITHALAWVGYRLHPAANPRRYGVELLRDIPYLDSGDPAHRLDVYRPKSDRLLPALMYTHGGGFSVCSKETHRIFALVFASQKYVVFNINYRLGPTHRYPAALEDVCAALGWVMDHAREHGADPDRLVIAGESAGGNLTASLAYVITHRREEPFARAVFDRAPNVRAVVPIYGIHDLQDIPRYWRKPGKAEKMSFLVKRELEWCAFAYVGRDPERAPLAHPLRCFAQPPADGTRPIPPFFIPVGTADPLLDDSRRLHELVQDRGAVSELHIYPGEIHGFNAMLWRPAARAKWRSLFEFLDRHVRSDAAAASA